MFAPGAISGLNRPGAVLSSVAQLLLPQLPSATFGAAGSGVAASCSVVCSSVALATGLIIAMGIATYTLRLAARNTPSGSPRFLALPVLFPPVIVPNRATTAAASAAIR